VKEIYDKRENNMRRRVLSVVYRHGASISRETTLLEAALKKKSNAARL
jgi:hypothetical protein